MGGYGSNPGNNVMGLGDWMQVANSVSAIGATIDRRRQQQRENDLQDQERLKKEQEAQAFNFFLENPDALDFDNQEKQTAKPSAIGEIAGVPAERPRIPIEGYAPESIAKARVAALSYWTSKKALSAESMRMEMEKAKMSKQEFIKGLSLAATSLANGDESGASDAFVKAYNQFYPDAHKMSVNEAGEFIMSSPTGVEKNLGKPNLEQMIDEFLGSPAINEKAFAQMSVMNKRAIQEMNRQSFEKPQVLYSKGDGKQYFAYAQVDPETKDRTVIVMNMPAGMPGARTLTAEEITGLGLHTEDAVKFSEDRQKFQSDMATDAAQRDYYADLGTAAKGRVTGNSAKYKQTPEDKERSKLNAEARKAFREEYRRVLDDGEFDTPEEARKAALEFVQTIYPGWEPDGDGAISQAAYENWQDSESNIFSEPLPDSGSPEESSVEGGLTQKQLSIYEQAFKEKWEETGNQKQADEYARKQAGITITN